MRNIIFVIRLSAGRFCDFCGSKKVIMNRAMTKILTHTHMIINRGM